MQITKYILKSLITMVGGALLVSATAQAETAVNINYSGTLIALPCTIAPGMDNLHVMMDDVTTKTLYRFRRSAGKVIEFELKDCDPNKADYITATFSTNPISGSDFDPEGLIPFNRGSEAKGAGIALEHLNGAPIKVDGSDTYKVPVKKGDMTVRLRAYVKAKNEALKNKTISAGTYTATVIYILHYE